MSGSASPRTYIAIAGALALLGVIGLAVRDDPSRPGRTAVATLVLLGICVYVLPVTAISWMLVGRGSFGAGAVAPIFAAGTLFLASRPATAFMQVWFPFVLVAEIVALWLVATVQRVVASRRTGVNAG